MAIAFGVFTFEEELVDPRENPEEVFNYIGAIERFAGMSLLGTCHWVQVVTDHQPGYLFTFDNPWLNSDEFYFILHDARNDETYLTQQYSRFVDCLSRAYVLAPLSNPEQKITHTVMTRLGSADKYNLVMEWATDTERVIEWIKERHGQTITVVKPPQ